MRVWIVESNHGGGWAPVENARRYFKTRADARRSCGIWRIAITQAGSGRPAYKQPSFRVRQYVRVE